MKERQIPFNAPMVRAVLDGSKTHTRRILRIPHGAEIAECDWYEKWPISLLEDDSEFIHPCPYGKPGDRFWVRESWEVLVVDHHNVALGYAATPGITRNIDREMLTSEQDEQVARFEKKSGFSPSIHMPRWASRINLEITDVRVERLNDISETDAIAEGVKPVVIPKPFPDAGKLAYLGYGDHPRSYVDTARESFQTLWESISGTDSWQANPWVWVIQFRRI